MSDIKLREQMCLLAKSMFDRGLTGGSSGNISDRTDDGGLIVSPTGSCFGMLDPADLSHFDAAGQQIGGLKPAKEMNLHTAFYDTRSSAAAMGDAVRGLAGKHSAVMLAAHGLVVAAKNIEAAVYAIEELEETAKLSLMLSGLPAKLMTQAQITDVVDHFDVEWE